MSGEGSWVPPGWIGYEEQWRGLEIELLRAVYESARGCIRFNGVDQAKADKYWNDLEWSIERVKLFDGGEY